MNRQFNPLWLLVIVTLSAGCSSLRKATLASGDDVEQALAEVTKVEQMALQNQVDLLAFKGFNKAHDYLVDAQEANKKGEPAKEVIETTAVAKALFEDAGKLADSRRQKVERILGNRAAAIEAGLRKNESLIEALEDLDDDVRSDTKNFQYTLSLDDFSEYQQQYLALETKAVQHQVLDGANSMIKVALDGNAEDKAPDTLRTAQLDYEAAMNMIASSPRSPDTYSKSVQTANTSATLVYDVMTVIRGAEGTPEHIALQIVQQKRALGELNTNVGQLQKNLENTQQSLQEKEGKLKQTETVLKEKEEKLARASTQVRFQQAMEEAQQVISPDEALVYQQGNKLVFRLKTINFRTGTSNVPETSKELIEKIAGIVKKLDAEKIVVQGHTDSIGTANVNKRLSTERANAVAKFLSQQRGGYKITYYGFGESHPIASNKTKQGRATNRRVDLVITVKK